MDKSTNNPGRTARLLALMKQGDDAFNSRDFAAMNVVHHPNMIAHITGNPKPINGREAHAATMREMFRMFPDVHVHNDPYPIQFGNGDWITVITRTRGTFLGEMLLPGGKRIDATGKAFDLDFCTAARWEADLLIEEYVFWDSALQARQLGLA